MTIGQYRFGEAIRSGRREIKCAVSRDLPSNPDKTSFTINCSRTPGTDDPLLYLEVNFDGYKLHGLLDSGSSLNIVGANAHLRIIEKGYSLIKCQPFHVVSANGVKSFCVGALDLPITIRGITKKCKFYIVPAVDIPLVLGLPIWKMFNLLPDDLKLFNTSDISQVNTCRMSDPVITDYEFLNVEQQLLADNIMKQYQDISSDNIGLGRTTLVEHVIDTGNALPIKQRSYRLSPDKLDALNKEVDKMLELGVIEPAVSPWNSPVLMVPKKDGTYRFCLDSRKLNGVTKKYSYPLPFIADILDSLGNSRYLSSIDLSSAFWQIPISPESRPKTAFTVPYRNSYQFSVTSFGVSNGPSVQQALMDSILGPAFEKRVFVYLDDIIVTGASFEEHASLLTRVLERLKYAKLSINYDKCRFFRSELKYLGHVVDRFGLRVDPAKVSAITGFPTPKTKKEVRRFLGMASWYRRFIEGFATKAAPLNSLTSTKAGSPKFNWSTEAEDAFNCLKAAIASSPVLACPDYSKPFRVYTDASAYGTGGVLTQGDKEDERPVAFTSRTLTAAERNFSATEREALSVIHSIETWRCYLDTGREFEIHTDHSSLRWFISLESPTGRLARWGVRLAPYNFKIIHRKGSEQVVPDALSRAPLVAGVRVKDTTDMWFKTQYEGVLNKPQAFPNMCIEDGKLYRYCKDDGEIDPEFKWKEVVMLEDRVRILKDYHDKPTAGHLGVYKTYHRIRQHYFWPALYQTVVKYVSDCKTCLSIKHETASPKGLMNTPKKCNRPFEYISWDIHGPLVMTKNRYRYILLITCCFSKYCLVIPLKDASSAHIIPEIKKKLFLIHGIPRVVLSDNGKCFISKIMQNFLQEYKIPHVLTTPFYSPHINTTERYNKTVNSMLSSYCKNNHRHWDIHLPEIQFALNSAKSESSGFSPNFLVYGRELITSGEVYTSMSSAEIQDIIMSPEADERLERLGNLEKVFAQVRKNLDSQHEKNKKLYNRGRRSKPLKIGDIIWKKTRFLSNKGKYFSAKLAENYEQFRIVDKLSDTVFKLQTVDGKPLPGTWHIKDFKIQSSHSD